MFRLQTITCPKCGNLFHVETESTDPPTADYRCTCPRCSGAVPTPGGEAGEPQPVPTGWAIRATACDPHPYP